MARASSRIRIATNEALADSKRLEREFDKAADEFFNPSQPNLFNGQDRATS